MVRLRDEIINGCTWQFKRDQKGRLLVKTDELTYYGQWTSFDTLTKKQVMNILKKVKCR